MKIEATDREGKNRDRVPVEGIRIVLDDMEAGFLRKILKEYSRENYGFCTELLEELEKYRFIAHEDRYGEYEPLGDDD